MDSRENVNCALIGLVFVQALNLPMSASNSFYPLYISFIMLSWVPRGGLSISEGCRISYSSCGGF